MFKRPFLLATLVLLSAPTVADPLFDVPAAKGRLAEACASILSDSEVQAAFVAVSTAADAAPHVRWADLPLEPLKQAVEGVAKSVASSDMLLLVDIHHCKRSFGANGQLVKLCPGSANIVNTGLSNYEPDDTERDLVRWHSVSAFAGIAISYPKGPENAEAPGNRTQLQCRAVQP